jgi:hypothetical protein
MTRPRPCKPILNHLLLMPINSAFVLLASFCRVTKSPKSGRRYICIMAGASRYIRCDGYGARTNDAPCV